jgi:hypothetical protein
MDTEGQVGNQFSDPLIHEKKLIVANFNFTFVKSIFENRSKGCFLTHSCDKKEKRYTKMTTHQKEGRGIP